KVFYPTSLLNTGFDILFFWVARMIMMGLEFRGEKPFSDVIIHATILDDQGQRMSKSKGTGVDPLELLDRYGADALRFALVKLSTGTQDFRFGRNLSVRRTEEGRNFVTKLWNACRFVAAQGNAAPSAPPSEQLAVEDRWILSRLNRVIQAVTKALEAYEFSRAADVLYGFVWDEFCDWYIEFAKRRGDDETARRVLRHVVHVTLRLLHPVCPFVTEEIWQRLFGEGFVAVATWPEADPERIDDAVELRMGIVFEAVKGVRAVRAHYGIAPSVKLAAKASVKDSAALSNLAGAAADLIVHLGNLRSFEAGVGLEVPPGASRSTGPELTLFVQVAGTFDREKELERSRKELANLEAQRGRLIRQLENEAFRRAKPEMAAEMEETLGRTGEKIHDVDEHIRELQGM
ncbi:MAG: class I tRNA ligase family protein, partial [Planctomycetes bacterium]|nr:class I tRNA ligase family protein [Planctomycetota bacterium]